MLNLRILVRVNESEWQYRFNSYESHPYTFSLAFSYCFHLLFRFSKCETIPQSLLSMRHLIYTVNEYLITFD